MIHKGFAAAASSFALAGMSVPAAAQDRASREEVVAEATSMANHPTDPVARVAGRIALGELRPVIGRAQREAVDKVTAAAQAAPVQATCEVVGVSEQGVITARCNKRPEPPLALGLK